MVTDQESYDPLDEPLEMLYDKAFEDGRQSIIKEQETKKPRPKAIRRVAMWCNEY